MEKSDFFKNVHVKLFMRNPRLAFFFFFLNQTLELVVEQMESGALGIWHLVKIQSSNWGGGCSRFKTGGYGDSYVKFQCLGGQDRKIINSGTV